MLQLKAVFARPAFMTLALWPVVAFACYSIYARIQSKYFAALLSVSGLDGDNSLVHQAFLYRNDIWLLAVLAPCLMALSFVVFRQRVVLLVWAVFIVFTQVLLYANLQSWGQVGRFLNWPALSAAVSFGLSKPEFVGEYIAIDGVLKLSALLLASCAVLYFGVRMQHKLWLMRSGGALAIALVLASSAVALYGQTSGMQRAPIAGSFYVNALSSLLLGDGRSDMTPIDPSQLAGRFEAISQAPIDDFRGPNFGVERNMNVLMFVMETGSIEFLDVRGPLPQHPVLARLRHKLYLGRNHFSTFPASAESNLSLLTGIYPPRALYDTCLIEAGTESIRSIPGFIPALRQQGYKTALYAPFKSQVPGDKVVFEMTGFEKVYYGQDHNPTVAGGSDNRTLNQLLLDIASWSGVGSPFAVAYFPQIGHGPWSENLGKTIKQRGESLARLQLDWLEKLVTTLDSAKQLDRTVIVLTGDHGVRTSMEDPRVRVGMIDEYSLHVPLLIFAPHADYSGVDESLPSSHVDLAVELAQLLGIPRVESMQGLAFHHPGRSERRQFMVASWYYGADGYRDPRESAMYSEMLDAAYLRPDRMVSFRSEHIAHEMSEAKRVRETITNMLDLQESWIRTRVCSRMLKP